MSAETSGVLGECSRNFWRNLWWREGSGKGGIGFWVWGESFGSLGGLPDDVNSEARRRLEGE